MLNSVMVLIRCSDVQREGDGESCGEPGVSRAGELQQRDVRGERAAPRLLTDQQMRRLSS